jgi:hypothetical protein
VRLEGLGKLINPLVSSRIELATFRLVPPPTTLPRAPPMEWRFRINRENLTVPCLARNFKTQISDNALPDQGCYTPEEAVIHNFVETEASCLKRRGPAQLGAW